MLLAEHYVRTNLANVANAANQNMIAEPYVAGVKIDSNDPDIKDAIADTWASTGSSAASANGSYIGSRPVGSGTVGTTTKGGRGCHYSY